MSLGLHAQLEALLFLSPDPADPADLADASGAELHEVVTALEALREQLDYERRGLVLRQLAGGWVLSTHPEAEAAARRLLARPRTPPLTAAQAETLAIIAYLQPVSRPEIARIRGGQRGIGGGHVARARSDRGERALAVRRRALPHHRAVPAPVRAQLAGRATGAERVRPHARARAGAPGAAPAGGGGPGRNDLVRQLSVAGRRWPLLRAPRLPARWRTRAPVRSVGASCRPSR
jgi:hypothetical protein